MAFDFPASPTEGQTFAPAGGPTYVFNNPAWKAVGQGQIAFISDTPPGSPANGALWFESDTGVLYIYVIDATSAQWVQVGGTYSGSASFTMWPAGIGVDWWGPTEPAGTLFCYGQSLLRTTYAALFAAIGTAFGAVDGTHFTLPDVRGRATAGKDNMGGTAANRIVAGGAGDPGITGTTLGSAGGVDRHTVATAEMPSHQHAVYYASATPLTINAGGGYFRTPFTSDGYNNPEFIAMPVGGGVAHRNVQPTIIANKLITTGGV